MSIKYVDLVAGSDSTGDGSIGLPYQSINKATFGLSSDDEVRIARSEDDVDLVGSFTFIYSSQIVTTTSSQVGILVPGDYIYADGEINAAYRVSSVSSSQITLYNRYIDDSKITYGHKVSTIGPMGMDATANGANGTLGHPILISGGWNLSLGIQDSRTNIIVSEAFCAVRGNYFTFQDLNVWGDDALIVNSSPGITGITVNSVNTDYCAISAGNYTLNNSTIENCVVGVTKRVVGSEDPDLSYINCLFSNIVNRQSENIGPSPIPPGPTPPSPDSPLLTDIDEKVDAIKLVTDELPDAGTLTSVATAAKLQDVQDAVDGLTVSCIGIAKADKLQDVQDDVTDILADITSIEGTVGALATAVKLQEVKDVVDGIVITEASLATAAKLQDVQDAVDSIIISSTSGKAKGNFNYLAGVLEQDIVVISTTTRKAIQGIWLSARNLTKKGIIRTYYKIDGVNYDVVLEQAFDPAIDAPGIFFNLVLGITDDFKVTYQADITEGSDKVIPYSIIYDNLE